MDLRFSDADRAFRAEVRGFIDANVDPGVRRKLAEHRSLSKDEIVAWQRTLNTRRWATPSWPAEHGGPGWSAVQRYLFLDELHQAPAPEPLSFNVNMIGPVLIAFGTPEQQRRFLPRIANLVGAGFLGARCGVGPCGAEDARRARRRRLRGERAEDLAGHGAACRLDVHARAN